MTAETEEIARNYLKAEDATSELLSLVEAGYVAHCHAYEKFGITKEKYLEFVSQEWDRGVHHRQVRDGVLEGNLQNQIGIVQELAAYLAIQGRKMEYLRGDKK